MHCAIASCLNGMSSWFKYQSCCSLFLSQKGCPKICKDKRLKEFFTWIERGWSGVMLTGREEKEAAK